MVEVSLLWDHRVIEVDAVTGTATLDPHAVGRALADRGHAGSGEAGQQCAGVLRVAEQVDAEVGADRPDRDPGDLGGSVGVLGGGELSDPAHRGGLRPQQGDEAALHGALVQLDIESDAEAADHVEQLLQRDALGVEQQFLAGVEDAQIPEHLALGGEERGVAAGAGGQALDVVGHLTL